MVSDQKYRGEWDKLVQDFEIVEEVSEGVDVIYYMVKVKNLNLLNFKAPMLIRNRTFVCERNLVETPYKGYDFIINLKTVEHKKKPITKKYVRAEVHTTAYFLTKIDGGKRTKFELGSLTDIKVSF